MIDQKKQPHKRVTVWVSEDDWQKLRTKLISKGMYSVSAWVREIIKRFLAEE